jgi:two-component system sensor histidine kinase TctE
MRAQTELLMRSVQDADSHEVLAGLLSSLDRQGRLVAQLLTLSRVEDALANASPDDICLDELARNIASEWAPRAIERGIDLGFEAPDEPVHLTGNAHALSEALSNILDNALRYCRAGDQVTVRVYREDGNACLAVVDTGPGVPEAALPKIFERFYRAPDVQAQGCGLGLAIVREVVEGHGGEVHAANKTEGGFEITMCIPQTPVKIGE